MNSGHKQWQLIHSQILLTGLMGAAMAIHGQQTVPLSVEDAVNTRSFVDTAPLAFSPDGKWIAYVVQENRRRTSEAFPGDSFVRTGVPSRTRWASIWISRIGTGEVEVLETNHGSSWDPVWSPDSRYLAFLADRGPQGQAQLWVWDSRSDQSRLVSQLWVRSTPLRSAVEWMPDGRHIVVPVIPAGLSVEEYVKRVESQRAFETGPIAFASSTVRVFTTRSAPGAVDSPENSASFNLDAEYLHDLAIVDVQTGTSPVAVAGRRIEWNTVSPNGQAVAFAVPRTFERPDTLKQVCDLVILDLATRTERRVASRILLDSLSWSPDGSWLAYGAYRSTDDGFDYFVVRSDGLSSRKIAALRPPVPCCAVRVPLWDPHGPYLYFLNQGALWRASITDDQATLLAKIPERAIIFRIAASAGRLWSPDDGNSTAVIAHDQVGKEDGFYRIDLKTGSSRRLFEARECYGCGREIDFGSYVAGGSRDKQVAYIAEDAQHDPELWVSDAEFSKRLQVTNLNPQFSKYKMGAARVVNWVSDYGGRLQGALLLPSRYEKGKRYPLLVWVYPMVQADEVTQFGLGQFPGPFNLQLFATRGYAVLVPDAPRRVGQTFASLGSAVLPGINKIVEMGIADPERIGVMGHSAGGYASVALIAQTERFKVAMEASGFADFTGFYGIMRQDGSGYQHGEAERYLGGDIWSALPRYIENSPIFLLDRVHTPLLIVHGSNDEAVSSFLADELFVDLRRLGKRVEYAKYAGESHAPRDWSYVNQLDVSERVIAWVDRFLKPASESAP